MLAQLLALLRRQHAVDDGIDVSRLAPRVLLLKQRIGDRVGFAQLVRRRGQRRGLARELVLRQREVMVHQPVFSPACANSSFNALDRLLVQRLAGRAIWKSLNRSPFCFPRSDRADRARGFLSAPRVSRATPRRYLRASMTDLKMLRVLCIHSRNLSIPGRRRTVLECTLTDYFPPTSEPGPAADWAPARPSPHEELATAGGS